MKAMATNSDNGHESNRDYVLSFPFFFFLTYVCIFYSVPIQENNVHFYFLSSLLDAEAFYKIQDEPRPKTPTGGRVNGLSM